MRYLCALVTVMAMGVLTTAAHGQTTATLRGRVRDAQAAPVATATVTVTSAVTGFTRVVPTSSDGSFLLANLPPATLDLTIAAPGFATATRRGLLLEVGQTLVVDVDLALAGVQETLVVSAATTPVDTSRSVVDAVIPSTAIEVLPLNGRNFLELALLVPGNAPAPNFDPTKSNTVVISSAGQLGRGGNITIDGADNNDDVVGGPLQNVTQESVQEFQIATNRFTAESGRSASSVINVVTRSGTEQFRGSLLVLRARQRVAGPAGDLRSIERRVAAVRSAADGRRGRRPAGARQGVLVRGRRVPQPGRRRAGRRARRGGPHHPPVVRAAPLDDLLGSGRVDWRPNGADALIVRYAGERADDTGASSLDRAIGSASQRQRSRNSYHSVVGTWTRVISPTLVNAATVSFSTFDNAIAPVAAGPQHTFPSIQDGSSFRVPQGTTQKRLQLADTLTLLRGAHSLRAGGEWQRVDADFDLGVFRDGRVELVEDFADLRQQRRRPRGRWRPALRGHAAQRQARSGAGAFPMPTTTTSRCSCRTTGACGPISR